MRVILGSIVVGLVVSCAAAHAAGGPSLPAPVYRTVAVADAGKIYVLGGHDLAGGSVTTVEAFDPATGRSRVVGTMPTVRADVTAAVAGGRAVLVGGFDGLGPQSSVWATGDGRHFTVVAHLSQPVRYPAVAALGSDVYTFGGLISGGEYDGDFSDDIQRIDLATGSVRIIGHLPTPLAHAMAAAVGGRIYLLGGSAPQGPSDTIRRLDPTSGRTILAGQLPRPVTDAAVATIGSRVYLLGGISRRPLASVISVRLR